MLGFISVSLTKFQLRGFQRAEDRRRAVLRGEYFTENITAFGVISLLTSHYFNLYIHSMEMDFKK